jgi:hypothetical protein
MHLLQLPARLLLKFFRQVFYSNALAVVPFVFLAASQVSVL